jgi:putative transposase
MPRPPRVEVPHGLYHITANATHGNELFCDDTDRSRFLRLLGAVVNSFRWQCHSYCLLSTHYHLVIRIQAATLARGMQYLNGRHAQLFNRRHERRGHAVRARYYAGLVETDGHAMQVLRYVALNPVSAGICASPEEWPWSSYAATLGLAPAPAWLSTEWLLGLFADDEHLARRRYRAFVEDTAPVPTLDQPQGVRPLQGG